MNLKVRDRLLKKLIDDLDMLGDGEEASEPEAKEEGEEKKPEIEVLSLDSKPEHEESEEAEVEGEQPEALAELKEDEPEEDHESLGDDGMLPHERLKKLMKG